MGTSDDKKIYNINADIAAGAVAKKINSRRLLLILMSKVFLIKIKN